MASLEEGTRVVLQKTKMGMLDGKKGEVMRWEEKTKTYVVDVAGLGIRNYTREQLLPDTPTPASSKPWETENKSEFVQWLKDNASDRGGDTPAYVEALAYGKSKGWLKADGGRKKTRKRVTRKKRSTRRR
jgi:hypothetical protein